jgi:UDP-N-acetylmuramate dehydrogenase
MMQSAAWAKPFEPQIKWNEPLARHNTWHVGGTAECYFEPQSREQLQSFMQALPVDLPVHWLGLGSNVLVRDGGIRGVVVSPLAINRLTTDGSTVFAEAGVPCARLARECVQWQLGPAAFWVGIPGTVGGALAMNAGCWNGETWRAVTEVEIINRQGMIERKSAKEFTVGYRHVDGLNPDQWFLSATFDLCKLDQSEAERIRELLDERRQKQPIGAWSGGSTFKNPVPQYAARLIEEAGLKGRRVGGAYVSDKHANFIINDGHASANDIETLIEFIIATVKQSFGVQLMPEVKILGEKP